MSNKNATDNCILDLVHSSNIFLLKYNVDANLFLNSFTGCSEILFWVFRFFEPFPQGELGRKPNAETAIVLTPNTNSHSLEQA